MRAPEIYAHASIFSGARINGARHLVYGARQIIYGARQIIYARTRKYVRTNIFSGARIYGARHLIYGARQIIYARPRKYMRTHIFLVRVYMARAIKYMARAR